MGKENILEGKLHLIEWCQILQRVSDDIWFQALRKDSWAIADVISHFIMWDVFLIQDRIPYFISRQSVPNVPIDVEDMNKGAIKYARSGISKRTIKSI